MCVRVQLHQNDPPPPIPHSPKCSDPGPLVIWGTMTLVIFYTNALSPYYLGDNDFSHFLYKCSKPLLPRGGHQKKDARARAATILKNFFSILKIIFFDSYQNLFRFLSKSFSILITEDGARARARVSKTLSTCK